MTIAKQIIFSSSLVALVAALATFMSWKNTQPIKENLANTLNHTTEEIKQLDNMLSGMISLQAAVFVVIKDINSDNVNNFETHKKRGKELDHGITTLKKQIKDFSQFNKNQHQEEMLTEELIDISNVIQDKLKLFFPSTLPFPSKAATITTGMEIKRFISSFDHAIQRANEQRFLAIKEEGKLVEAQISNLNFWVTFCGVLTFLMAIVFGQVLAYNLSKAIRGLRSVAQQLNEGNYEARVGSVSNNEFGRLGETFNGMAANLQQSKIIENQKGEVERLNKALKVKNDSLDSFVYRVSHDLKAPVVNIKSLLQLVKIKIAQTQDTGLEQPFLHLDETVTKLEQTIIDLLEVTRIEQSLEVKSEWINLKEKLEKVKSENSQSIELQGVEITSDFKVPELYFSVLNLDSILSNLITNSIKYSSRQRNPEIHLSTKEKEGFVCLQISDNGIGMDLEKHGAKLFGMFNRFHNHVEGSGVGLYIVKKLLEDAGGRIDVDSKVERGTTLRLFFDQRQVPVLVEEVEDLGFKN